MHSIRGDLSLLAFLIILCSGFIGACSNGGDSPRIESNSNQVGQCDDILILTAMPAELAPLLDAVEIIDTFQLGQRVLYSAKRGEHRMMLAMTGIGLVNAEQMTTLALENFPVRALLYSGVAGSTHRIGDVVIVEQWLLSDSNEPRAVDSQLLQTAKAIVNLPLPFQRCTPYPLDPPGQEVCLEHAPQLILGSIGRSADPFGGNIVGCVPEGGDIFGCAPANAPDGAPILLMPSSGSNANALVAPEVSGATPVPHTVEIEDMESAMALAVASSFNVPAIAVRSVSDGTGDPLNLNGFPAQFFAYYRLAAENSALATLALFDHIVAECVDLH